jgi:hypothetical protein
MTRHLVVVLGVSALSLLLGCTSEPPAAQEGVQGDTVTLFEVSVGDCLNDAGIRLRSDLTDVPRVSCAEPHDSELYAILAVEGSVFPGEGELIRGGQERCANVFGAFIGVPFADSTLDFRFYYPTASSWAQKDRSIHCVVFDPGMKTTGSLLGAKR